MAEIKPFRAYTYDAKAAASPLAELVAPPYDVIDSAQKILLKRNPYNIAHIILGKEQNSYEQAAAKLKRMVERGILKKDSAECLYIYEQVFSASGRRLTRTGFVGLLRIEGSDRGIVLPHEATLQHHTDDRLQLLKETRANTGLIFCVYGDAQREADSILERCKETTKPFAEFTGSSGVLHRLYRITSHGDIAALQKALGEKNLVIADGHHRYETALNYMKERSAASAAPEAWVMAAFINTHNPGLEVFPIHRLVSGIEKQAVDELPEKLEPHFKVSMFAKSYELLDAMQQAEPHTIGFWNSTGKYFTATTEPKTLKQLLPWSSPKNMLDATVLHKLILEKYLGIPQEKQSEGACIEYVNSTRQAVEMLKSSPERFQLGIFLKPATARDVCTVAESGEKMPQKSTFFYPKLWSGLLLRVLGE